MPKTRDEKRSPAALRRRELIRSGVGDSGKGKGGVFVGGTGENFDSGKGGGFYVDQGNGFGGDGGGVDELPGTGTKTGTVKFFHDWKGFGFISQDDGGEDLFAPANNVVDNQSLVEGDSVRYDEAWDDMTCKVNAQNITGGTGGSRDACEGSGKGSGQGVGFGSVGYCFVCLVFGGCDCGLRIWQCLDKPVEAPLSNAPLATIAMVSVFFEFVRKGTEGNN